MERLSELEKWRIAELSAQGLPSRVIGEEIGRAHRTVWGYIRVLRQPGCIGDLAGSDGQ